MSECPQCKSFVFSVIRATTQPLTSSHDFTVTLPVDNLDYLQADNGNVVQLAVCQDCGTIFNSFHVKKDEVSKKIETRKVYNHNLKEHGKYAYLSKLWKSKGSMGS